MTVLVVIAIILHVVAAMMIYRAMVWRSRALKEDLRSGANVPEKDYYLYFAREKSIMFWVLACAVLIVSIVFMYIELF